MELMARSLKEYHKKRDFSKTTEPEGKPGKSEEKPIFVIQKHDATTLHYDFRLEVDGVLVSWAVPKGPSIDPRQKRLAIQTEDHPLEYADFEGVIPESEYGGGTVIVWDRGGYRNLREERGDDSLSMAESIEEGKVEVWLEGNKLQGGFALIRTGFGKGNGWLLIKMDDEMADARRDPVSTEPDSVITGRSLEQVREEGEGGG
jgi:DNA ligase D-like protein (predicted 3'-phosphoesterase)